MKLFGKYGSEIRNFENSNTVSNSIPYFFEIFGNQKIQKMEISYLVSISKKIESNFEHFKSLELLKTLININNKEYILSCKKISTNIFKK